MLTREKLLVLARLALAAGSLLMFGDTIRLIAEWRMSVMSGIFVLNACLLAAVVFAYRMQDAKGNWPLSIMGSRPMQ